MATSRGKGRGISNRIPVSGAGFDPEASALFARMIPEPDAARKTVINDFIVGLRDDLGISSLSGAFDCLYFFAAHAQQPGRLNWAKDDHNIIEVNAPTWTEDEGYTGNGINTYLDLDYIQSVDSVVATLDSTSYGVYSRTDSADNGYEIGAQDLSNFTEMRIRRATSAFECWNNQSSSSPVTIASPDSLGLFVSRRDDSGNVECFKNGTEEVTGARASGALTTVDMVMLAVNNNGVPIFFNSKQMSFGYIGNGTMSMLDLFTRVEAYMDALGKGVV